MPSIDDMDDEEPFDLYDALHEDPDDAALSRARAALVDDEEREREERERAARETAVVGDPEVDEIHVYAVPQPLPHPDDADEDDEDEDDEDDEDPEPQPAAQARRPQPRPPRRRLSREERRFRSTVLHAVHNLLASALEHASLDVDALKDEVFEPRLPRLTGAQLLEVRRDSAAKAREARRRKREAAHG